MRFMKISSSARYTLGIFAAISMLAGCSSGGSQIAPTGSIRLNAGAFGVNAQSLREQNQLMSHLAIAHRAHGRSWMAPDAKKDNLVYISDGSGSSASNEVYVYSYPKGKLKGTLTDVDNPQGMCVDKAGDVWVTDNSGTTGLTEFAHGGTAPIATLSDSGYFPDGCAIDPTTGNLAVTSLCTYPNCGQGGDLAIYKNASGTPTTYSDPAIRDYYFCGYDDNGNLFLDGATFHGTTQVDELPSDSGNLTEISVKFITIAYPGGVQWDGKDLAIGDQAYEGSQAGVIYRIKVKGSVGKPFGETILNAETSQVNIGQFWIDGKNVVAANFASPAGIWKYPAGGNPTKLFTGEAPYGPIGAVVSPAK